VFCVYIVPRCQQAGLITDLYALHTRLETNHLSDKWIKAMYIHQPLGMLIQIEVASKTMIRSSIILYSMLYVELNVRDLIPCVVRALLYRLLNTNQSIDQSISQSVNPD